MAETTIFLSYARADGTEYAKKLTEDLETLKAGYTIWRDTQEIHAGEQFIDKICNAIRDSKLVLAILTPSSVRRANDASNLTGTDSVCLNEIQEARFQAKKPIIPVMVRKCVLPFAIDTLDYVDITRFPEDGNAWTNGIKQIVEAIELVLAGKPVPTRTRPDVLNSLDDIFERFLGELRKGFYGRQWIFDEINAWLTNESEKVLVVAGPPGSGKSAVAAELVFQNRDNQVLAYHVCIADRPATVDPATFVRSISDIVATRIDEYRTEVNDPALQDRLQQANEDPATAFQSAVLKPLLKDGGQMPTCYILVDGLDEALAYDKKNNILQLLKSSINFFPSWLRIVVTCQGEAERLMDQLLPRKIVIQGGKNRDDVEAYVNSRLKAPELSAKLVEAGKKPEEVANWVRRLDAGNDDSNMLFVKVLLNEIEARPKDQLSEQALPRELDGLYESWLERFFQQFEREEQRQIRRLLGIINAAAESLTRQQVARASGANGCELLPELLRNLSAYLPENDRGIRAFHKSFSEWLAKDSNECGADMEAGRQCLAELCRQEYEKFKDALLELPIPSGDNSGVRQYVLRHGVRHLLDVGDYAKAVDLLAVLFNHASQLDESLRLSLGRDAKEVSLKLASCDPDVAKSIDALKLASILRRFYEIEPQYNGIRVLMNYHADKWEEILDDLLSDDDFVIRFTIARALADRAIADLGKNNRSSKLDYIVQLSRESDVDRSELGAYALKLVYAKLPNTINGAALNTLAASEIYSSRSVLGDLLLHLAFTGRDRSELVTEDRFWNAVWDFNKLDVWDLRAIGRFCRDPLLPPGEAISERDSYQVLLDAESLRQKLLEDSSLTDGIRNLIQKPQYRSLSLQTYAIRGVQQELENSPALPKIIRLLFAHPLWDVAEDAASVLSDMSPEIATPVIEELLEDKCWRLRYGAIEAAFGIRYVDDYVLFTKAVRSCYDHPNCRVRALCVENLTAQILACESEERGRWCANFAAEIKAWLKDEDCWVLEHIYRLFRQLDERGDDYQPLWTDGVSRLFENCPNWYRMKRADFLRSIEAAKIRLSETSGVH